MSGSMTPPPLPDGEQGPEAERMPPEWDMRLRWPPYYAIFRRGVDPNEVAEDQTSPAHMPSFTYPTSPKEASVESQRNCNSTLSGSIRQEYVTLATSWRRVELNNLNQMDSDLRIPWRNEAWWKQITSNYPNHFATIDPKSRGLISFFQSSEHGTLGRRTSVKPGRYLGLYAIGMSEKTMLANAQWFVTGHRISRWANEAVKFEISGTPEAFEEAYLHGPRSCMSGSILVVRNSEGHKIEKNIHPVRVYAAGDLAIAVLRNADGRVASRVIVHPERLAFGRIYPNSRSYRDDGFLSEQDSVDCIQEITNRLRNLGYKPIPEFGPKNPFEGSRILLVPANDKRNEWMMPYIDGALGINLRKEKDGELSEEGEWVARLSVRFAIPCQEQRGTISFRLPDDPAGVCRNCGHKILRDRDIMHVVTVPAGAKRHAKVWCRACATLNTFRCAGNGVTYSGNVPSVATYGGGIFSQRYVDERPGRFVRSDKSGLMFDFDRSGSNSLVDGTRISNEEAGAVARCCVITGNMFLIEEAHATWMNVHKNVSEERIAQWLRGEGH